MIRENEFYHGSVLLRLCRGLEFPLTVKEYQKDVGGAFLLEFNGNKVGLYIKYCTKRLSPWRFTFHREHQLEIDEMKSALGEVHIALVCGKDGVVVLTHDELRKLLDENHEPAEWVSVSRSKRQMYCVKGKDGNLDFKVGESDFPKKTLDFLRP